MSSDCALSLSFLGVSETFLLFPQAIEAISSQGQSIEQKFIIPWNEIRKQKCLKNVRLFIVRINSLRQGRSNKNDVSSGNHLAGNFAPPHLARLLQVPDTNLWVPPASGSASSAHSGCSPVPGRKSPVPDVFAVGSKVWQSLLSVDGRSSSACSG